ncbi:MAG: hypothetical protein HKN90_03005 [Flavobacteriaceae bacterium]|nr:hypothetical protein [Flavobacteriaceae bacterium]
MYKSLPYKTKQFLFLLVKLAIIVGAFYFIYNKVVYNEQIQFIDFIKRLEGSISGSSITILILIGLSLLNWFFEILKWKSLATAIKKITFFEALQQSLGALTASLFTPNRIGEYGAKAIYYKKGNRRKIMLLNLIGNGAQMLTTTLFGVIGLIFFISHYEVNIEFYRLRKLAYVLAILIVFFLFGSTYTGRRIQGFYIDKILNFLKELPFSVHFKNMAFSIIRYLIFSFQFYYLLSVFNIEIDYFSAMALIGSMYFIASVVPSLSFFDWLIKGSVAVWVFSFYPVNELIMVTITLVMWSLNFAIPAIFGSYFVLNFTFPSVFEPKSSEQ